MANYQSKLDEVDEIEVELTLTEVMQKTFADNFDMEIDLLQGKVKTLPDGRSEFKLRLSGIKKQMMVDFFRMAVSITSTDVTVNGLPLNKN